MKKQSQKQKPYWDMTTEELAKATKKYDRPIPLSKTKPLTKREREQWERMRKGPHVSVFVTRDSDGTFVRLEPDVMKRSMRYAASHNLSLSELVNRSLKGLLSVVD